MKLSLILEAVDRMTAPARKAAAGLKKIADVAKPTAKAVGDVGRAVDKVAAPARKAAAAIKKVGDAAKPTDRQLTRVSASTFKWMRMSLRAADGLDRLIDRARWLARVAVLGTAWVGIKAFEKGAIGTGKALGFAARKARDLVMFAARWGTIGAAAGVGFLTAGMIGRNIAFEDMAVDLERIEGSAAKAKAGLAWVRTISRDVAVPLDDLAAAFINARKAGLDPMSGSLQAMLDKAIESKRGIEEIVEAVKDAKRFKFDGLDALDIGAERKKGRVTFSWLEKDGKRAVKTVREDARAIEKALAGIFSAQAGGAGDARARTLSGMWQRFKNMVGSFQLDVGDAGIFDFVKDKVQSLLDWVNEKAKDGSLKKWAEEISNNLKSAFEWAEKFARDIDWDAVADGLGVIARIALTLAGALGAAAAAMKEQRYQNQRLGLEQKATSNSPAATDFSRGLARYQTDALDKSYGKRPVWQGKGKPYTGPMRNGMRGYRQEPLLAPPVSRPAPGRGAAAQPAPKGRLEISIKTPPGTTARPTKVAATGMDLEVNTGRAMGAFA